MMWQICTKENNRGTTRDGLQRSMTARELLMYYLHSNTCLVPSGCFAGLTQRHGSKLAQTSNLSSLVAGNMSSVDSNWAERREGGRKAGREAGSAVVEGKLDLKMLFTETQSEQYTYIS